MFGSGGKRPLSCDMRFKALTIVSVMHINHHKEYLLLEPMTDGEA